MIVAWHIVFGRDGSTFDAVLAHDGRRRRAGRQLGGWAVARSLSRATQPEILESCSLGEFGLLWLRLSLLQLQLEVCGLQFGAGNTVGSVAAGAFDGSFDGRFLRFAPELGDPVHGVGILERLA